MTEVDLTVHADEKSTYVVTAVFRDEARVLVVPTQIAWTLSDGNGSIINNRLQVPITVPASTVQIVLSGDDLAISSGFSGIAEKRVLTIEALYNSSLGNDLPLKQEISFALDNLVAIS